MFEAETSYKRIPLALMLLITMSIKVFAETSGGGASSVKLGQDLDVVRDFGADASGDSDSTSALNRALSVSDRNAIRISCGIYKISAPLMLPASGVWIGNVNYPWYFSYRATVKPCVRIRPVDSPMFRASKGVIILGGYGHVEGIGIDGGAISYIPIFYSSQPFDELIHVWTNGGLNSVKADFNKDPISQGTRVRDSTLTNAHGDCVDLESTADFDISRNDINGCAGFALNVNGSSNGTIGLNIFQDSTAGGMRLAGLSGGNVITGNRFNGNVGPALYFSGAKQSNNFSGNSFQYNVTKSRLDVESAQILWNNSDHSGGCQQFEGNSYLSDVKQPTYLAAVQLGGVVTCGAFYEPMNSQGNGIFSPTLLVPLRSLKWSNGQIIAEASKSIGFSSIREVQLHISSAYPENYNGTYWCKAVSDITFSCPLAHDPGQNVRAGNYVAFLSRAILQPFWAPTPSDLPGPFRDDADAAEAGVPVNAIFVDGAGVVRRRLPIVDVDLEDRRQRNLH